VLGQQTENPTCQTFGRSKPIANQRRETHKRAPYIWKLIEFNTLCKEIKKQLRF